MNDKDHELKQMLTEELLELYNLLCTDEITPQECLSSLEDLVDLYKGEHF